MRRRQTHRLKHTWTSSFFRRHTHSYGVEEEGCVHVRSWVLAYTDICLTIDLAAVKVLLESQERAFRFALDVVVEQLQ